MKLSDVSIRRPVFAAMMILALVVLGWFSYTDMSVELWPEVEFPFVVVTTEYAGASAETIETEITKELEKAVNQISGIRHIQSKALEGYTYTFIEFELSVNAMEAAQDVREKVAGVRDELPDDAEEPVVSQFDPGAQAVMSLAVSGARSPRDVTEIADDKIKPRLEAVTGVGSVELIGGSEREILIELNPERMESYQVSVEDVRAAVMTANLEIPGGRIEEKSREYVVRVLGRLSSVQLFEGIVVKNQNGTQTFLSDVAAVKDTIVEKRSMSTFNGEPAVALNIIKQSGANVVQLAEEIREVIGDLQVELPPDLDIQVVNDNSTFIEDSIDEILFNIRFGTLLAVIVIFLFLLDLRPTIITGLSIPVSIIATFTAMKFFGFTINFMTLLGLSLAVGILIDDSIVVVENIYRRVQEGESPFKAAFTGTKEIGLAVMATTFAIMVVFLPVAFMEGIIGRFFYQFGMTVAFAVLISLFVAFTLVPMLASRTSPPEEDPKKLNPANARGLRKMWLHIRKPLAVWNRVFDSMRPAYRSLLNWSLNQRFLVMFVATVIFFGSIAIAVFALGQEFIAQSDQGKIYINVETPQGTTVGNTLARIQQLETICTQLPQVENSYITIGGGQSTVTEGTLLLLLKNQAERELTAQALADSVRVLISDIPGAMTAVALQPAEGGGSKLVEFSIRGESREELARITHTAQRILRNIPGATDVDNSLEEGQPELQISVDRQLADDLGVNVLSISQTIRHLVEGDVVTQYKEGDKDYDVRIRLAEPFRDSEDAIGRILVASSKEVTGIDQLLIPVKRVATLQKGSAIGEYSRYDRLPEVRVNANVLTGYFGGTISNTAQAMFDTTIQLPPGYAIAPVGEAEIMAESFQNIIRALILSIIFIFLLLASQYESFWDPFSIMLSLPLSLIGAVLGLLAFNSALNIQSMIGIVMLMGIVTKNAILLIDFVKQRRRDGAGRREAILESGPIRLRPILMTTLATVFGMLPLALGIGPGAEFRAPMARAVIGGMLSSTLLTLVVVPVVYTIIDDFVGWTGRLLRRLFGLKPKDTGDTAVVIDQQTHSAK